MSSLSSPGPAGGLHETKGWQIGAVALCVLFGSALILNTQTANDGMWYWYGFYLQHRTRLYHDMHLPLQPLFIMLTSANMALFGKSWLASKIPALLELVAYCIALLLVLRSSRLSDRWKALVVLSTFFVSNCFEAYRLDDYHVLGACFEVWCLVFLLRITEIHSSRKYLVAGFVGILAGLCLMNRFTNGITLFVGITISLFCLLPSNRLQALTSCVTAFTLTIVAVVSLTGDSLHDWAMFSIVDAAGSKGGADSVLMYPLKLPFNAIQFLFDRQKFEFTVYLVGCAAIFAVLIAPLLRERRRTDVWKFLVGMLVILMPVQHFRQRGYLSTNSQDVMLDLSAVLEVLVYAIGILIVIRFLQALWSNNQIADWDRRQILFAIPVGELIAGSMSSAGGHGGLYMPIATTILLLPVASPLRMQWQPIRSFALGFLVILTAHCAVFKYFQPYKWQRYRSEPLFVNRHWYQHPFYGAMYIDEQLLHFIQPVCAHIGHKELLSLPYSYANYFCVTPPWHGYVQTFFDTSSSETISGLMERLNTAPPEWILYQRQLDILSIHEHIYNRDQPLPQRYLDNLIEAKLAQGQWHTVYVSRFGADSSESVDEYNWMLINTR